MAVDTKLLSMFGLARKAGKVIAGTEQVTNSIRKGIPCTVYLSTEASDNTKKRVRNCCGHYNMELYELDINTVDIGHMIGKKGAISAIGITDMSFTAAIKNIITKDQ
jgi:Ribosomal protein HS6-type (S12/L30/L7a)